ncbi:MAG TPA: helix-turn-helix domain-containing protein [Gaiellaceae bacterium]|nr:helix-turn-helix domain-containing protein [Gaiellaceae bacterium]
MFEIGNSLREARVRRGIDFAEAELATKIRGKYLRALEEEQFEVLPAHTYVKGFLRTYADYLGLDGQLYVDEFNSRFLTGEERELRPRRSRPRRHRRLETNVVLIALAVIAVLTIVVISAWKSSGGGSTPPKRTAPSTASRRRVRGPVPLLTVVAKRGSTHLTARRGGAAGDVAFDGTVQKGDGPVAIRGTRLWVQIDSPENLRVIVQGHTQRIPGSQPRVIVVTARGWRPA